MVEHAEISHSPRRDRRLLRVIWLILRLYLLATAYHCLQFICNCRAIDLLLPDGLKQTPGSQLTLVARQSSVAALLAKWVPTVANAEVPDGDFGVCRHSQFLQAFVVEIHCRLQVPMQQLGERAGPGQEKQPTHILAAGFPFSLLETFIFKYPRANKISERDRGLLGSSAFQRASDVKSKVSHLLILNSL